MCTVHMYAGVYVCAHASARMPVEVTGQAWVSFRGDLQLTRYPGVAAVKLQEASFLCLSSAKVTAAKSLCKF